MDGGGDRAVAVPRGLFSRRRDRFYGGPRRPIDELINNAEGETDLLTAFKSVTPYYSRCMNNRPMHTCCSVCFPENRNVAPQFMSLGIRNCFNVPTVNRDNNWYIRHFAYFAHFWSKRELAAHYSFVNLESVIENQEFFSVDSHEDNESEPSDEVLEKRKQVLVQEKRRALAFLNAFAIHPVSERFLGLLIRLGAWLASKIFSRVFDAICVHDGQIKLIKSIRQNHPVIYVPLQKSNWDSFILNYVLVDSDIQVPFSVGKRSLMTNPFLWMFARLNGSLGCIKRRTKNTENLELDISPGYPAVGTALFAYLQKLLENGMSLSISPEKHQSSTGKPGTVLVGTEFFHFVCDLVKRGKIEDAIFVPVNITYEKCPDENIIYGTKTNEGIFRKLWNLFRKRLGFVRVDFAHPFSVREFQEIVMTKERVQELLDRLNDDEFFWMTDGYCDPDRSNLLNWNENLGSVTSLSSVFGDLNSQNPPNNETCLVADTLAYHSIYNAWRTTPFMSTHLLAFLLVTRYRNGASVDVLVDDLKELLAVFRERKQDIGFFRHSDLQCIIQRAARLLGPTLISEKLEGKTIFYKPNLERKSLIQLGYYSNHVTPFFAMDSIIATAVFALENTKVRIYNDTRLNVYIDDIDLIKKATELAILLKAEFYFHPPCQQLEIAVKSAVGRLRDSFSLIADSRKASHYNHEDVDEYDEYDDAGPVVERLHVQALQDPATYRKLCQARNLVTPYIQVYAEAFKVLYELLPPQENDGEDNNDAESPKMFELTLRAKMMENVLRVSSVSQEVAVMDTIKNFIVSMKSQGIIEDSTNAEDDKIMWGLCWDFSTLRSLNVALDNILSFISF